MKKLLSLCIAVVLMACGALIALGNQEVGGLSVAIGIELSDVIADDSDCEPGDSELLCTHWYRTLTQTTDGVVDWSVEVDDGYQKVAISGDNYILYGTRVSHCCGLLPLGDIGISIIGAFSRQDGSLVWYTTFSGIDGFGVGTHKILTDEHNIYILETFPTWSFQLYDPEPPANYDVTATYHTFCPVGEVIGPGGEIVECSPLAPSVFTLPNDGYAYAILLWKFKSSNGTAHSVKQLFGDSDASSSGYTPISPFQFVTDCDSTVLIQIGNKYYTLNGEPTKANMECKEEPDCNALKSAMQNGDKSAEVEYVKLCSGATNSGIAGWIAPIASLFGFIVLSAGGYYLIRKSAH